MTATTSTAPPSLATTDPAAFYRALLDSHPEPTFALSDVGTLIGCNRAFARFVGRPADALLGRPFVDLVLAPQRTAATRAWEAIAGGTAHSWQAEFEGPGETVSVGHVTLAPVVVDGALVGAQGIARDVTVYQVIEEQLQARVYTDPLTGLANRTQLLETMERALRRATLPGSVAVLLLDVDDFKRVNDALGHAAGDRVLEAVAERMKRATRGADLAARLGGDEFAVALDGLSAPADVARVVERVYAALGAPVTLAGRPHTIGASIGVALWDGLSSASELLRNADLAMHSAKAHTKGGSVVFDAGMHQAARERLELAADLREAIASGEITAAFQPIVELTSGRVIKAEALARWHHPTRGPISPAVFIPLAEEMGLIESLGVLMLRHGCEQLRRWEGDAQRVGVTVNVSGRQFERGTLVADVRDALAATGADASGLTLELTESVAMRHPARVLETLTELAALGVTLAIDDFGTGYSSLSYLQRFPVRWLKIDKSFVDGLGLAPPPADGAADERPAEALVRAMVSIADALALDTVAEGVETAAQRDALVALGCRFVQGYFYGRPGPAGDIGTGAAR